MSTKKRLRPTPAMDLAEAEVDDATVREELGRKKQMKPKAAFANGAGLDSLVQRSASSLGVVTLFSALALNYYMKNGPPLSKTVRSCLDIQYGYSSPPPPPKLSKSRRPGMREAKDWAQRAWLSELQGGQLPNGTEAEISTMYASALRRQRRQTIAADQACSSSHPCALAPA